jgi:hypothetical protein
MNLEQSTVPVPTSHSAWNLWRNPIFRRYCQSRLRPKGLAVWLLITVLVSGFICAMDYAMSVEQHDRLDRNAQLVARNEGLPVVDKSLEKSQVTETISRGFVQGLFAFQGVILFMIGTAMVSGGMTAERDEGVIDYQRLVPMRPIAKVIGYLFGLPVREYVMFLVTLPFAAWLIWRGNVPVATWLPVYTVLLSSALLYHLTGLLIGTVARNRRWAFLASIGTVFALYTVIPQLSKFGLVFFKYLTVQPVVLEIYPSLLPRDVGAALETARRLAPTAKFFNLEFPELVFTLFSQVGLVITFTIMLCRKWRRAEAHLLGKLWATGFFIWLQVLLLGNALPLVDPGTLFPSREFRKWSPEFLAGWKPDPMEAVGLSGLYGVTTLGLMIVLGGIITPNTESQIRGWRRARKHRQASLPLLSDAATAFWWVMIMAISGAAGWFLFTRGLVESRWFGAMLPLQVFGYFAAVLLVLGISYQVLLEAKGMRAVGLATIFVGVVPLMLGAVCAPLEKPVLSAWFFGMSPASMPFFASGSVLPISELPHEIARAVPRAFHFWLISGGLVTLWLVGHLRSTRKAMAEDVLAAPAEAAPPMGP